MRDQAPLLDDDAVRQAALEPLALPAGRRFCHTHHAHGLLQLMGEEAVRETHRQHKCQQRRDLAARPAIAADRSGDARSHCQPYAKCCFIVCGNAGRQWLGAGTWLFCVKDQIS